MTSVTRSCFTTQRQTCKTKTKTIVYKIKTKTAACKTKTKTIFWSQTGLVLRPTVSDHITGPITHWLAAVAGLSPM